MAYLSNFILFLSPMTKFLIRICLTMSFLLLWGNSHLHAYTYRNGVSGIGQTQLNKVSQIDAAAFQDEREFVYSDVDSGAENQYDKTSDTEVEEDDDESVSLKKYAEITNFCAAFFYTQLAGYYNGLHNHRLPFCKHFSYSSSFRYIILRTIRI